VILLTVGTHRDGFPRLTNAVGRLELHEPLVAQHGYGPAPAGATSSVGFLAHDEMRRALRAARVVISHAGVGSILSAAQHGHRPVVVPRLAQLGEHVDDHQSQLARALEATGRAVVVWDVRDLQRAVDAVQGPAHAGAGDVPLSRARLAAAVRDALQGATLR
jgi:beta-1,4-N-acetylglucosaminyltransferase